MLLLEPNCLEYRLVYPFNVAALACEILTLEPPVLDYRIRNKQIAFRAGDRDIEQPELFIEGVRVVESVRRRQNALNGLDDEHRVKLQPFRRMYRAQDQRGLVGDTRFGFENRQFDRVQGERLEKRSPIAELRRQTGEMLQVLLPLRVIL